LGKARREKKNIYINPIDLLFGYRYNSGGYGIEEEKMNYFFCFQKAGRTVGSFRRGKRNANVKIFITHYVS